MPFHVPINILDFIFKGMMIGVIASAPMGPVGILCVQRTLNKGRWYGMATGMGAAVSDIIYAGFAGFGMSFVMDFITNTQNRFYLQLVGSVMLLCFGLYTYRSDPTKKMHQSGQQKGTLWYNAWTAFLVTFSNPLIVFLFLAMYAQFAFVLPDHPFEMVVGFASIGQDPYEVRYQRHQDYQPDYWCGRDSWLCHHAAGYDHQFVEVLGYVCSTGIKKEKHC